MKNPGRDGDEPARSPQRGLHPVILVICILLFVFLFFLIRDVRTQYVGEYGSEESAPAQVEPAEPDVPTTR
ncbi:hypothetical protein [Nesterenkonia sp. HG001]|uniref:hypothetical protein n=1 Tax=Nesterenkonia sp. HG001 TaxID=2983207 RepID=UPI002AC56070|nr:hypothetical protein [Nesterenkonia sp. HG001]MDZ5076634.1 hypothetical protein [Nesterenkonia sp. HG001]